ncbi:hypothetical protein QYM36_004777 [Artemia franciscana]|uniref:F-box domain-containing protein n=2 Tax=Artemia franciscana TaxID=6661 RepID=A0AA88LGQ6_ARTSF|nr:hypothetical protein QYM36_004777 [Artemia franciscana]
MIMGGHWNLLPEEIIRIVYEYLSFRDIEAASQTCKSWYAVFLDSSKLQNIMEFVVHQEDSKTLAALSRLPSRCKRITFKNISLEFSGAEGEKIFSHWKCLANHIKYLTFIKCNMNERTIGNLLSYCTSLVNLTIDDSDYPFMTGRIFSESICNLNNLATVRRLEIQSSQYLSDAILMRISNIMPNLEHFSLSGDQITFHPAIWKRFYPSRQNFKYSDSVLTFKIVQNIIELRSETLTSIDFSRTQIGSDGLIALCKIPGLKLTVLNLEGCKNISQPGFEAIFSDQTGIIDLNINFCCNITDSIFRDICLRLERLKKFSFRKVSGITLCGLECITLLKEVRYLDMGYSDIFHDRQTQIVREKSLSAHLTHLDLGGLAFGQSFLKLISAQLKGLQYLNIQSCPVNDSMFAEITSNLLKLNVLKVAYLSISDQALTGVARVVASDEVDNKSDVQNRHRIPLGLGYEEVIKTQARCKRVLKKTLETLSPDVAGPSLNNLKRLKELDLTHCVLVSDLSLMFAFKFFCLKTLSIAKCNITDEGLESLVAQPMPLNRTIEELDLSECTGITDRGLCKLLPELKRLRKLKLAGCIGLTVKTIETVMTYCPQLRCLDVSGCCRIPLESCYSLRDALPLLRIVQQGTGLLVCNPPLHFPAEGPQNGDQHRRFGP